MNSKIERLEQKSLTVEKKINLTAQISSLSLVEGSSFSLDLNLDESHSADILIQFSISGGTSGLTRFSSPPTSAVFLAGTTTQSIVFATIDDLTVQGDETFTVQMTSALSHLELETSSISFTVLDNDVAPLPSVTVAKTYPTNGAKWLHYIKGNNGGSRFFNQPDTACVGTETGSTDACIHGGDKLKVIATGYTTCTGLTISDYLNVFDWLCDSSSGTATFYSIGLKMGKGLSDVIDFTNNDWLNNYVTVRLNSTAVMASTSAKWWNKTTENPIAVAPDSSASTQTLTGYTAGTILTIPTSGNSLGYNINQDSLGFVVKNGSTLTFSGVANNCRESTGETVSADLRILICAGTQKFLWVEGSLTGLSGNLDEVIAYVSTNFSRMNKIRVAESSNDVSLFLRGSNYNNLTDLELKNGTNFGFLWMQDANYNTVTKFRAANMRSPTTYSGLNLEFDANYNILQDIIVTNWSARGISMHGNNNILGNAIVTNCLALALFGQNHVVNHVTSSNNGSGGVVIDSSNGIVINQLYSGINMHEIFVQSSTYTVFSQVALKRQFPYSIGFTMDTTNNTKFTNNILLDSDNSSGNRCYLANSGADPGMMNMVCGNQGPNSNANWVYNLFAAANPLVGSVSADSSNAHGSSGTVAYSAITDWLNFENIFRFWSSSALGQCSSGNCVLMDYRIRTGDTIVKNKSGNGSTANAAFTAGAACPAPVGGNMTLTDQQPSPHTFLFNAIEISGDGIGNDNTLCESNDACIYSPNFGAYQGEGDYKSNGTCTFQDGTVTGVTMYAYPTNGG